MKPNELELKIVKTIRQIRIAKNLKQINLAHALNISEGNYSKIENGKIGLSISQLKTVADYLQISYLTIISSGEALNLID